MDLPTLELPEFETAVDPIEIDPVEEMRLRTWARKNYAPLEERDDNWHPVILDEMLRKDREFVAVAV